MAGPEPAWLHVEVAFDDRSSGHQRHVSASGAGTHSQVPCGQTAADNDDVVSIERTDVRKIDI